MFSVQDEIARAIVGALRIRLASAGTIALARRGTVSPEAHDLYLQGRFFYEKRDDAGLRRALDFFTQAIARDSSYAEAWAGLADTYSFMSGFGYEPPHVMFSLAREAAARALQLDSTLVEAHTSLAYIKLFYDWDWAGAGREFDRALAIDASFPRALLFHSWYYVAMGRLDDARREIMRARSADPLSPIINVRVATMLHWQGRYAEATIHLRRVLEMDSTYSLARAQLIQEMTQLGQCDAIRKELATHDWTDRALNYNGAAGGYALAVCGDRAAAQQQLDSLTARARQRYVSPEVIALIHAGLGNADSAFAWLDRARADRTWSLFLLKVEPMLKSLRGDPRFDRLVRAVGLP